MIYVWSCPTESCGYWRRQTMEDLHLLAPPRCARCSARMRKQLRRTHNAAEPPAPPPRAEAWGAPGTLEAARNAVLTARIAGERGDVLPVDPFHHRRSP